MNHKGNFNGKEANPNIKVFLWFFYKIRRSGISFEINISH